MLTVKFPRAEAVWIIQSTLTRAHTFFVEHSLIVALLFGYVAVAERAVVVGGAVFLCVSKRKLITSELLPEANLRDKKQRQSEDYCDKHLRHC